MNQTAEVIGILVRYPIPIAYWERESCANSLNADCDRGSASSNIAIASESYCSQRG